MSDKTNNEITYIDLKPDINGVSDIDVIRISEDAIKEIKKLISDNEIGEEFFLRIGLRGGGNEGTEFFIEFDSVINQSDKKYVVAEIPFIIDSRSLFFLLGFSINYSENGFFIAESK